ncbi:MAG: hypothetical protein KJN73_02145, partial [Acidimicrobiia bacterium]|nr:hypothetical protein [Acidimicrobiia bacterium]
VAGLFMDETGRIPDEGDHIVVDGVSLTVLLMDRRRIARLRVEI